MTTVQNQPKVSPSPANSAVPAEAAQLRLQQALEALTINLDDELMRYRRSRYGDDVPPVPTSQLKLRKRRRQSLQLINVKGQATAQASAAPQHPVTAQPPAAYPKTATQTSSQAAVTGTAALPISAAVPPPPNPRLQQILGDPAVPTTQAYVPHRPGTGLMRQGGAMTPYRPMPDDYMASTEALLDSLPGDEDVDSMEDGDYRPSLLEQLSTPLGLGLLLLLLVSSAGLGYLVTSPETIRRLWDNPLITALRGPQEESQTAADAAAGAVGDSVETGLQGIGPDLSESEFQDLDLGRLSTLSSEDAATTTAPAARLSDELKAGVGEEPSSPTRTAQSGDDAAQPDSPDTDVRATRVERVRTEVTTPLASPQPAAPRPATSAPARPQATAQPRPAAPSQPQAAAAPQARPAAPPAPAQASSQPASQSPPTTNAAPSQPPQPLAANPAPQPPAAAPPAPLSSPTTAAAPITQPPPNQSSYYVVTDYTGDQSLESARQAVGDAYVRNFPNGARIQMGSFSQESAAQNMVQELQGQGIPAQVYSP